MRAREETLTREEGEACFKHRATARPKSNLIRSVDFRTAVARSLKRAWHAEGIEDFFLFSFPLVSPLLPRGDSQASWSGSLDLASLIKIRDYSYSN